MPNNINKKISLVLIGNFLEFYDLGLFGFLSVIITPLYFPCDNKLTSLLASAGVFAIGFVMRPIGAIVFGYIGDTLGRKICLSYTVLLMAMPTTIISLLPTYAQIGICAPLILMLCRLLQGFCTGGEYNNAAIYILESINSKKIGLFSGLMVASSIVGFFLASIIAAIVILFSDQSDWLWRLPFLLGAMIGIVGFYLRKNAMSETHFQMVPVTTYEGFFMNGKSILVTVCIGWLAGTLSLSLVGYMTSYLTTVLHLSLRQASLINNTGLGVYILFLPVFGFLSDQWGYRRVMMGGTLATIFLSYPFFALLSSGFYFFGQIGLAILAALFLAPMHAYMLQLFPKSFRCRGISTAFALGVGVLGGTAPFISTLLVQFLGASEAPAIYYIVSGLFGLIALKVSRPLEEREDVKIRGENSLLRSLKPAFFKRRLKVS